MGLSTQWKPYSAFSALYNVTYFDDPFRIQFSGLGWWTTSLWEGLMGTLLSPSRGLFVYSPIFLFSVLGIGRVWWSRGDPLLRYLSIGVLFTVLLVSKWGHWWGGWCFGPRLLADLTPLLAVLLILLDGVLKQSHALKGVFAMCVVWSISAHAIGAFWDDGRWNANVHFGWHHQERLWLWTDNQLVNPPLAVFARAAIALRGLQTSRTAPEHLSASYQINLSPTLKVQPSQPIQVRLDALNTGEAVWLGTGHRGIVRLSWRWLEGERHLSGWWVPLRYDVFPRQSHDFWTVISSPSEPGIYLLELGLVSESVAMFSDRGSPPIQITVTVVPIDPIP